MAFIDRVVEYPGRVVLTPVTGETDTYDMTRSEGEEYTQGTLLNATNLNTQTQLDSDVQAKFEAAGMTAGTNDNVMSDALDMIASGAFVIEAGSVTGGTGNHSWRYRKWSNGMIEAWGYVSANAVAGTVWTSPIYYYDINFTWASGIFDAAPNYVWMTSRNYQWIMVGHGTPTQTGVGARLIKPTTTAQAIAFNVYVVKYPSA